MLPAAQSDGRPPADSGPVDPGDSAGAVALRSGTITSLGAVWIAPDDCTGTCRGSPDEGAPGATRESAGGPAALVSRLPATHGLVDVGARLDGVRVDACGSRLLAGLSTSGIGGRSAGRELRQQPVRRQARVALQLRGCSRSGRPSRRGPRLRVAQDHRPQEDQQVGLHALAVVVAEQRAQHRHVAEPAAPWSRRPRRAPRSGRRAPRPGRRPPARSTRSRAGW